MSGHYTCSAHARASASRALRARLLTRISRSVSDRWMALISFTRNFRQTRAYVLRGEWSDGAFSPAANKRCNALRTKGNILRDAMYNMDGLFISFDSIIIIY